MTTLEIILSTILYISLGLWITYKRNWYDEKTNEKNEQVSINFVSIILMPLNLIIVIVREFIIKEWDNN